MYLYFCTYPTVTTYKYKQFLWNLPGYFIYRDPTVNITAILDEPQEARTNLYVFISYTNHSTVVDNDLSLGVAWIGTLCDQDDQDRVSINLYTDTDLNTGITIAHEIGHNLNMSHDFNDSLIDESNSRSQLFSQDDF